MHGGLSLTPVIQLSYQEDLKKNGAFGRVLHSHHDSDADPVRVFIAVMKLGRKVVYFTHSSK